MCILSSKGPSDISGRTDSAATSLDDVDSNELKRKRPNEADPPKKRHRSKKPIDAPRRPKSAYMFFLAEFRANYKIANPDTIKVAEVAKAAGEVWRSLSAEQRNAYEVKSVGAKAEYAQAKRAYDDEHPKPPRAICREKESSGIKRPQSAYFLFLSDFRAQHKVDHPDQHIQVSEMGRLAGEKWKSMSEEEKAPYHRLSTASKAEYARQKTLTSEERVMFEAAQLPPKDWTFARTQSVPPARCISEDYSSFRMQQPDIDNRINGARNLQANYLSLNQHIDNGRLQLPGRGQPAPPNSSYGSLGLNMLQHHSPIQSPSNMSSQHNNRDSDSTGSQATEFGALHAAGVLQPSSQSLLHALKQLDVAINQRDGGIAGQQFRVVPSPNVMHNGGYGDGLDSSNSRFGRQEVCLPYGPGHNQTSPTNLRHPQLLDLLSLLAPPQGRLEQSRASIPSCSAAPTLTSHCSLPASLQASHAWGSDLMLLNQILGDPNVASQEDTRNLTTQRLLHSLNTGREMQSQLQVPPSSNSRGYENVRSSTETLNPRFSSSDNNCLSGLNALQQLTLLNLVNQQRQSVGRQEKMGAGCMPMLGGLNGGMHPLSVLVSPSQNNPCSNQTASVMAWLAVHAQHGS